MTNRTNDMHESVIHRPIKGVKAKGLREKSVDIYPYHKEKGENTTHHICKVRRTPFDNCFPRTPSPKTISYKPPSNSLIKYTFEVDVKSTILFTKVYVSKIPEDEDS